MARPKQPMLRMALFAGMLFLSRLSDGAAIGTPTKQVDKKSPADDKKPKDAQKADESMSGNRRKRPDRWGIQLTYNNGEELYDEWAKLNAVILVGPTMEEVKKNSFLIFRDLSRR